MRRRAARFKRKGSWTEGEDIRREMGHDGRCGARISAPPGAAARRRKERDMNGRRWTALFAAVAMLCAAAAEARGFGAAGGAAMPRGDGGWVTSGMRAGTWGGTSNGGHWHGGDWHHGGHWHGWYGVSVGIYLGPGFYWGWPYGPYAYDAWPYYDAYGDGPYGYAYVGPNVTYAYPNDPAYYFQAPAPEPPAFRYYCSDPKGYYPQVTTCTQSWLRVLPSDAEQAGGASDPPAAPAPGK
jgi:hypothetical protein